ncbi:MAG: hypothetical protein J0I80_08395 [Sphingomonas sp.]|nr:hypothetical protein [Sphingomonas sp.]
MQITERSHSQAYHAAIALAERRARHSYYDQHVIKDREAGYLVIDEGDHPLLPEWMIDAVVHTVAGTLIDEY